MSNKVSFSPSLMCMELCNFKEQLEFFDNHADFLHIDIMDGHFVPNITLSMDFVKQVKKIITRIPVETHLMVRNPEDFIQSAFESGVDLFIFHAEAVLHNNNAFRIIKKVKELGMKVGVALSPATPLILIKHYVADLDKITFLTVDPGFAGQQYIDSVERKINSITEIGIKEDSPIILQIDGSCNKKTYPQLKKTRANDFVLGTSGLFGQDTDIKKSWHKAMEEFNNS